MRRLILLRHSKTVAAVPAGDHARHLSPRGIAEATMAAHKLWSLALPDYALVSDARRTRETFDRIAQATGREVPHRFEPRLYGASEGQILDLVTQTPETVQILLVIGHNPGLGGLARRLARSGSAHERRHLDEHFPTSSFVVIALDEAPWSDAERGGRLEALVAAGDD